MISINVYEIVWQIINFTILVYFMNRLLFQPLISFIEKRTATIKEDLNQAESDKTEAAKLLEEQKAAIKKAYEEAKGIRNAAETSAKAEHEKIVTQALNDKKKIIDRTQQEVEGAYAKAKTDLLQDIGQLSTQLAQKLIHTNVDEAEQNQVVDDFIKSSKELSQVQ